MIINIKQEDVRGHKSIFKTLCVQHQSGYAFAIAGCFRRAYNNMSIKNVNKTPIKK